MGLVRLSRAQNCNLNTLPTRPVLDDIAYLLSQSLEKRGELIALIWLEPGCTKQYRLTVNSKPGGGEAQWRLYEGADEIGTLIWSHVSCDIILVHNLIVASCKNTLDLVEGERSLHIAAGDRLAELTGKHFCHLQTSDIVDEDGDSIWLPKKTALSGDIGTFGMFNLLQHVLSSQMTGKIVITGAIQTAAEIYTRQGMPVYAHCGSLLGDDAVIEMLTFEAGSFAFEVDAAAESAANITRSIESLLLCGLRLIDAMSTLQSRGFSNNAFAVRKGAPLSEAELNAIVGDGNKSELLTKLYAGANGQQSVGELISAINASRHNWATALLKLIEKDLLAFVTRENPKRTLKAKQVDQSAICSIMTTLRRTDTGLFAYPAFLYFLEQEYFRTLRTAEPITIMLLQMKLKDALGREFELPTATIIEVLAAINSVKRSTDLFAHYDDKDFVLLMPGTKNAGADIFAHRLKELVPDIKLSIKAELVVRTGIASLPEDPRTLGMLLAAAENALQYANQMNLPIVHYEELASGSAARDCSKLAS